MGVNTKAILRKGITIEQIKDIISEKYRDVELLPTNLSYFWQLQFKDGDTYRCMSISFGNSCEREYGIAGVWCSLGCSGNSVGIMRYLCETFGGYLDENDCDDDGFYPINIELYSQGSDFTELERFRMKLLKEVGADKIRNVMKIIEEYNLTDKIKQYEKKV